MPLSDREQQILEGIERQLYDEDPKFAHGVADTSLHKHLVRNIRRGIAGFVAGLALLVAFFFRPLIPIGVGAFLLMLVSFTFTYANLKKAGAEQLRLLKEQSAFGGLLGRFEDRMRDMKRRGEP